MIGTQIGNYRVTGQLAQGGMGAVYRGHHISLPREVVVKSILLSSFPPQAQDQLKARFLREAYIQSQLDHPNVVRVYEFFATEDNYYLVMEFIDGMSLRDLIKRQGALNPASASQLLKQGLAALDYAHNFNYLDESGRRNKGVVHRDIKPANLLLDGMARLKITDFGIVKLSGERGMTRTGFNPGTAEYMSPEQIRGKEVDPRSDIYSLGITFYEALTGKLPFPYSESGSEYEVLKGHIEVAPTPISTLKPDVPPGLAAVVMKALEKNPDDRYQSAAEFLQALNDGEQTRPAAKPQVTHSITELITEHRQATAELEAAQSASYETNVIPNAETAPGRAAAPRHAPKVEAPPPSLSGPGRQSSRSGLGLIIGFVALIAILLIGGAAYYFLTRTDESAPVADTGPSPAAATTQQVAQPVEDARLKQARAHEAEENYVDAIKLYEQYLAASPQAADSGKIQDVVKELKTVEGLLAVAELELSKKDFAAAKRDFEDALKLKPSSERARKGLEAAAGGL